eukprot:6194534-Pleurochrysis_carterae.AAC.7
MRDSGFPLESARNPQTGLRRSSVDGTDSGEARRLLKIVLLCCVLFPSISAFSSISNPSPPSPEVDPAELFGFNFTCSVDADCATRNVGNCCGQFFMVCCDSCHTKYLFPAYFIRA